VLSEQAIIDQFCCAMREEDIDVLPADIIADGHLHRIHVDGDRPGSRNGWYVLHITHDPVPAGQFGCNRRYGNETKFTWKGDRSAKPLSAEERKAFRLEMNRRRREREAVERAEHEAAATRANEIWQSARETTEHPYLTRKGIRSYGLRVGTWEKIDTSTGEIRLITKSALLIPIRDIKKEIHSLQAIFPSDKNPLNRDKDYLAHGQKRGMFYSIGKPVTVDGKMVVIIVEGYATGASVHEASGHAVIVAFDASNLMEVGKAMRARFPDATLIFASDHDRWTLKPIENPGLTRACEASAAVGGVVAIPRFDDLDGKPTDFNDLHAREGLAAVEAIINAALEQPAPEPEQAEQHGVGADLVMPEDPGMLQAMEEKLKPVKGGDHAQAAVSELNHQHAVVLAGDKTVVLRECMSDNPDYEGMSEVRLLSRDAFKMLYENRSVWVEIVDREGKDKSKMIPIADWWLKSPDRRQYLNGITFRPDGIAPDGYYNLWHGYAVDPLPLGIFRNAMKCRRLLRHMKYNVCLGIRGHYRYLLAWMADLVQDPARKKGVALVLRGNKGSGKSKVAEVLASLFGLHAIKVSQMRHLVGNFNRHLAAKLLLVAEESFWAGDKSDDGPLKDMITSKTVTLEAKGVDAFEMPSYLRIVMVTNNDWAVPATEDERRYFVLDVGDDHRQDLPYFAAIDEQMDCNVGEGRRALLSLLQSFDLSGVSIRKVPETAALRKQRALSMAVEDQFIHDALVDGELLDADWNIGRNIPKSELYGEYVRYSKGRGRSFTLDSARFGKHFMKRTGAVATRLGGIATGRTRAYKAPSREEAAKRFAQEMKIDLAAILDGTSDADDNNALF